MFFFSFCPVRTAIIIYTNTYGLFVQDLDSKLYVSGDTLFEWSRGPAISGCMYKQSVRMCVNNNSSTYGTEGEKEHKSYFRLRDNKLQ